MSDPLIQFAGVSVGYPPTWLLTPVKGKRPYRDGWQSEPALDRKLIDREIKTGRATGIGLRLGEVSSGLVAVDRDGPSTAPFLDVNGWELPATVSWTSGKPGRAQYLYRIPEGQWAGLENRKVLDTGTIGEDGKAEQVEIR